MNSQLFEFLKTGEFPTSQRDRHRLLDLARYELAQNLPEIIYTPETFDAQGPGADTSTIPGVAGTVPKVVSSARNKF